MKRLLLILPLALLLFSACHGKKQYFQSISTGETWLQRIVFDDENYGDFTVITDVLYAGEDTSSRYKMIFYLPEGWDDSYPILLDRYFPIKGKVNQGPSAYAGMPVAESALKEGNMIVVLVAYDEWTAIPDILLAQHFLIENDDVLPGDSRNILTAAYFEFD